MNQFKTDLQFQNGLIQQFSCDLFMHIAILTNYNILNLNEKLAMIFNA